MSLPVFRKKSSLLLHFLTDLNDYQLKTRSLAIDNKRYFIVSYIIGQSKGSIQSHEIKNSFCPISQPFRNEFGHVIALTSSCNETDDRLWAENSDWIENWFWPYLEAILWAENELWIDNQFLARILAFKQSQHLNRYKSAWNKNWHWRRMTPSRRHLFIPLFHPIILGSRSVFISKPPAFKNTVY